MAKNYTFSEAVEIISKGENFEEIAEIGKKFPVLSHMITVVATKAGDDFVNLMKFMPEHVTMNKVNSAIKSSFGATVSDEAVTEDNVKVTETEEVEDVNYDNMSGSKLYEILKGKKLLNDCKKKIGGIKKEHMLEYLNKYYSKDVADDIEDVADDEVETEEEANPYDGKTAKELFNMCKERKIKAELKKPAKYYIELLMKADEEAKTAEDEADEDDDWGDDDDDEVEEAHVIKKETKSKKAEKAVKNTKEKEEEEEDDDDDDWDI